MQTITSHTAPDLDLKNRFYRDNLSAMAETKLMLTAKQEAENRLVIDRYNQELERTRITGVPMDPRLE